ncbi:MAG: hypothetical protein CL386_03080 [Acidiferrobacter sp.]|nr:hypothetical protein [Acidiferrobacter sp.]|tara:strand:+ start:3390 stop:4361 length:972 start_codon:yes stop_codon:yes gene_type:complete
MLQGVLSSRKIVDKLPHDRAHLLSDNGIDGEPTDLFLDSIDRWLAAQLSDDGAKDEGTGASIGSVAISKGSGLVAGRFPIDRLIGCYFDSCEVDWLVDEGESVLPGREVLRLSGPSSSVLSCERVLMNILGRMSGIATLTAEWVGESLGVAIACTRKTAWGLLDKWAVHVGGGLTHRLSRSDALMIKENDLAVMGLEGFRDGSIRGAVSSIDLELHASFSVIEVRNSDQAVAAASAWSEIQENGGRTQKLVLLLDNMGPQGCRIAKDQLEASGLRKWCILEGSGGVTRGDLPDWVRVSGVDVLSTSEINMAARPLDFSMLVGD